MSVTENEELTAERRETFWKISEVLIPATSTMPSAAEVGAQSTVGHLLDLRPDLKKAFFRGLDACASEDAEAAARRVNDDDPQALAAIGLIASAVYYFDPKVMELIGYPGQTPRTYDVTTPPDALTNGQLQRVIDRGPIFRPTPD